MPKQTTINPHGNNRQGPYRNDLHRLTSQPESWFKGHTPNWPDKTDRCNLIKISVKINIDGCGLTKEQAGRLCKRIERMAVGTSGNRIVSAII